MRAQWSYKRPHQFDDAEITVTVHDDGSVLVEVDEEHAMDSYNHWFTCEVLLPPDKVRELAEFFSRAAADQ